MSTRIHEEIARQFLAGYMAMTAVRHRERAGTLKAEHRESALRTLSQLAATTPELIKEAQQALDETAAGNGP